MTRSPMVPVRDGLHGSLAAVRPQLRKLCAALGPQEAGRVLDSPVLLADSNGAVSSEAALACLLGRVADAVSRIVAGSSSGLPMMRRVQHPGAQKLPKAVRRGRRLRQPLPSPVPELQQAVF
jgi:hypothetical protein